MKSSCIGKFFHFWSAVFCEWSLWTKLSSTGFTWPQLQLPVSIGIDCPPSICLNIYISLFQVLKCMSSLKAFLSWFTVSLKESQILLSLSLQWSWHFGRIFCSKTSNFFLYLPSNLSNRLSIDSWRLWIVVLTSFIPMLFSNMYSNEIGSKENKITVFMYVKRQHI